MKLMVDKIFCDWKVSQSNMSKSQNSTRHLSTTWNAAIESKMGGVQKTIGFQPNEDKK